MARAASPILGAYPKANKYSGPLIERDGWQPVRVNRFEGPLTKITGQTDYRVSEAYPHEIGALLNIANASVSSPSGGIGAIMNGGLNSIRS